MAGIYTKYCFLCIVINAIIVFKNVLNGEEIQLLKQETKIYSSVVLPCPGKSQQKRWKHEDRNLFVGSANIGKLPVESVDLSQDYSLLINNVTLIHDGTYQCFRNSVMSVNYSLFVAVPPSLSFTLNGHDYLDGQLRFSKGETVVALCKAFDGRPAAQLTWMINEHRVNHSTHNILDILYPNANNQTIDVTSILTMKLNASANGTISCVSSYQSNFTSQKMTVPYRIIALEASPSEIGIQDFVIPCSVGLFVLLQCGLIAILKRRRAACVRQTYLSSPAQKVTTNKKSCDAAKSLRTIETTGDAQPVLPDSFATDIDYERNFNPSGSTWTLYSNDDSVQDSEKYESSYSNVV